MRVKYSVTKVDLEAGFVTVHVEYEGGITGDYAIEVQSFSVSNNDPEQYLKVALDSLVRDIAKAAFPPPQLEPPALLNLLGWANEFEQP